MPSQTNKSALKQLEKTEFLVVSAKTQKLMVNGRLAKAGPEIVDAGSGEAPPAPDWNQLQEWGIAALDQSAEEVRQTDRDLRKNRVRLRKARQDRNGKVKRVASGHRSLRQSFTGTYGPESLPLVGLDAEPARALLAAREQMREVVERMRDPQLTAALPEPVAGQQPIELATVADARDAELGDLEVKMAEIDGLRKQTDEALFVRGRALAKNRRVYSNVGRLLEGVYRLAGLDQLADRIRVTERSRRKKTEESAAPAQAEEPDQQAPAPENPEPENPEPAQEGGEAVGSPGVEARRPMTG